MFASCSSVKNPARMKKYVYFETSKGDFVIGLYEGTPKHKNNFIKNCNTGIYDSCLMYSIKPWSLFRVGIRAGEKEENVLKGDFNNHKIIPPEINSKLINKTGAVGMLRVEDESNVNKDSDSRLFYLVEGMQLNAHLLSSLEAVNNSKLFAKYIDKYLELPGNEVLKDSMKILSKKKYSDTYKNFHLSLRDSVRPMMKEEKVELFSLNKNQTETYQGIGGSPNDDNKYTVFGEIVWNQQIMKVFSIKNFDINFKPTIDIYFFHCKVMNKRQFKEFLKEKL